MSYTVSYFKNLIQTYPTWAELETYLSSVKVRVMGVPGDQYRIIKLDATSTITESWLRSVVWDNRTKP